ncbi:G_PROTEIN_RECEP_F1_2 domain-containing protein [Caenorhabditis elegans]|uniref:G_PROTEIN_RECEP_F1_2 domain-containing protein n=1 Tax=Caenorhabditis elegans TaxID=6239 RepID=Q1ENI6_CAEEL|nr:G_PROTEIN_RECEP_F1_2 domain-containing protein [Caenorhabditis elegans]CCD73605.2 G_PROTEIN_RECEP_F1_2 domain-containing protein [Caenorhabditis elegans]
MYNALTAVQSQLSKSAMSRHKIALRSLIMQFMTTPVSFIPAFMLFVVTNFPTRYSQEISRYSMMIATTHSTLNSLVVITTYPEFRKIFWKRNNVIQSSFLISSTRPSGSNRNIV